MRVEVIGDCRVLIGGCRESLRTLPDESVHCVVTSPPYYGLRDYGVDGQIGLEETPEEYVAAMVDVFREVRRVLRSNGTVWLNLGDSYAGSTMSGGGKESSTLVGTHHEDREGARFTGKRGFSGLKPKDLIGIPWRVAFALQADGWWLRQDIIWHKPNPMPESVTDRCTKAHEYVFLLSKSARYWYDAEAVKEDATDCKPRFPKENRWDGESGHDTKTGFCKGTGAYFVRNRRSVWTVSTKPYSAAHFATYPPELIEPCVLAGCPVGGTVLDPFGGSGTTAGVALKHGRRAILCELSEEYAALIPDRIRSITDALEQPRLFEDPVTAPVQGELL